MEFFLEIVYNIWSIMFGDYLNFGIDSIKGKEIIKSIDNMESINSIERRILFVIFIC